MIRRMTSADIPAGMRLKEAAGWNQTEQDWANVLAIEPEGCWVFEAEEPDSGKPGAKTVAGSATAVCYGQSMAWIGMVLVLPEFRRRGIARALMEHALEFAEGRQVGCVKLDATDMGRPLYARLGFGDESLIERWGAVLPDSLENTDGHGETHPLKDVGQIAALDRRAFGADRMALLRLLAQSYPDNCLLSPQGYVMARPGSNAYFLGPCVAETAADARRLIRSMVSRLAGQPVFWDLLPENRAAGELAEEMGFERKRSLLRMSRPGCSGFNRQSSLEMQFATAGFEYG